MIYIKNNNEVQTIFIPRNELQKEAFVASVKSYEDGLKEGFNNGIEYQKDQLLNLYVTENGQYEREDGWGRVEVAFEEAEVRLQKKDITLTEEKTSVSYDDGYDGLSEVKIDAKPYGEERYSQGYLDGQNSSECPVPKLDYKDVTITNNGTTYLRAEEDGVDGYNLVSINVDVPTEGGSCNLGEEWITIGVESAGAKCELIASDNGYDGYSKVTIEVENFTADCPMSEIWTAYNLSNKIVNENISGGEEYVRGTITSIQEVNAYYGNATYIIDDIFKVYRGKWFNGELFYDGNEIQVGDWVIVKGTTQNYNGQAQFKAGSQIVEHKRCEGGSGNCDDAFNQGYMSGVNDGYNQGYNDGQANCGGGEGGSCNLINPIIFSETEGNTINAESVEIPTFVYEGNQYYNVWALNMSEYEEFKIQIRFQPNNGGFDEPVNIFGCEDTDWDSTTFGARIYMGYIYFRMSGDDVAYLYNDSAWYDVEMGYNSSKRWIIVNGETLYETDHAWFNKPSQNFMIGAINSGGNAFRPFYGKIAATYIEANGSQVYLLPKEEGHMDIYWNDMGSPWIGLGGENNARFENDWMSGNGMKSITWLGKRTECPSLDGVKFGHSTFEYFNNNIDYRDDYSYMFDNCRNLLEAPQIEGIRNAVNMFRGCESIRYAPSYNTFEATDLNGMYANCHNLENVGSVDCSSLPNAVVGFNEEAQIFDTNQYPYLVYFGGLLNLKLRVKLQGLIALNEESVINIFNGLYDFSANGETPNSVQGKLTMSRFIEGSVNTHKHIAEAKGWTITIE